MDTNTDILTVAAFPHLFSPGGEPGATDVQVEMDWDKKIPELHIHWVRSERIFLPTEPHRVVFKRLGYKISNQGVDRIFTTVKHLERAHMRLYNGERFGWYWVFEQGSYLQHRESTLYTSPQARILLLGDEDNRDVIKSSMVEALTRIQVSRFAPWQLWHSLRVQRIFVEMISEATEHAHPATAPTKTDRYEVSLHQVEDIGLQVKGISPPQRSGLRNRK